MIPWWFTRDEVVKFLSARKGKKIQKVKTLHEEILNLKTTLDERIRAASHEAKVANHHLANDKVESSKEAIRLCSIHIASTQATMNLYVSKKLEVGLFESLSTDGFLMPQELEGLRDKVDLGLYSTASMSELEQIIRNESDPFADIGIDINSKN
tara:strand:- start:1183 stop:1644 length:462 start_codon:yes stop_codon:yes gene_type:complete